MNIKYNLGSYLWSTTTSLFSQRTNIGTLFLVVHNKFVLPTVKMQTCKVRKTKMARNSNLKFQNHFLNLTILDYPSTIFTLSDI